MAEVINLREVFLKDSSTLIKDIDMSPKQDSKIIKDGDEISIDGETYIVSLTKKKKDFTPLTPKYRIHDTVYDRYKRGMTIRSVNTNVFGEIIYECIVIRNSVVGIEGYKEEELKARWEL